MKVIGKREAGGPASRLRFGTLVLSYNKKLISLCNLTICRKHLVRWWGRFMQPAISRKTAKKGVDKEAVR